MSTAVEVEKAVVVEQPQTEAPAAEKSAKAKKAKAPKEKKPKSTKTAAHPPYFQMIKEALLSLKERTGSSPQAIAKSIEARHKAALPANFRKIMGLQLKNLSSKGKLIKIKASYKLSEPGKKVAALAAKKPAVANTEKKNVAAKPAKKTEAKKNVAAKKKVAAKPVKKAAQPKKRAAPAATKPKQPKSIKAPAAKKAKKAAV